MYTTTDYSACVADCPAEGSYWNNDEASTMHCDSCDVACSVCSGPADSDDCTCAAGYNFGTVSGYTSACVEDCATGMFYDYDNTDTCTDCIDNCDVCSDSTTCS